MMRKLLLVFAQTTTVCLAILFVVSTLRPDLLPWSARGGLVTNDDITPDGSLTLEFKAMKDVEVLPEPAAEAAAPTPPPGVTVHGAGEVGEPKTIARLSDTTRTFKPGEILDLTDTELLGLNITATKFVDGLLRSVDHFGRAQLGEGA